MIKALGNAWMALGAAAFSTLIAADIGSRAVPYRFEPEARAVLLDAGLQQTRDPKVAVRANGSVHILSLYEAGGHSRLGLFVSNNGGDSFEPPVPVSETDAIVMSHGENSPSVAYTGAGGMDVYALWEQTAKGTGSDLMFARSLKFGRAFEKPIRVTDKTTPSQNGFSYLAVAPDRNIYAVWLDGRDGNGGNDTSSVYLARSSDRGASFGKNVRVASGVCPCCRPSLAFGANGDVYVSWRQLFPGDVRDIAVAVSHDRGQTFESAVRAAQDDWKITGCPHSGASMVVKEGRLFIAWYSEGSHGNSGVRVSYSDDGAKSFSRPLIVSGNIPDANHPVLSLSDDGRIVLIFQGRDPSKKEGWGPAHAFVAEVSGSGTVSPPVAVPGARKSISYPTAAAGTLGRVFIAWTEPGQSGPQVMFIRGRSQ
jgi:hypothetical protein